MSDDYEIRRLVPRDEQSFHAMLALFASVFDEYETYQSNCPSRDYIARLLSNPGFVGLVASQDDQVVGALAAYELPKFEQERSEFYIYDLAVDARFRRRGIATALINETRGIARERGGWVVFVQADQGDEPAISLYSGLGVREDVLHFDIPTG